jgi:alkylation response protein AidB-like acyl-CoA dehydrogenase
MLDELNRCASNGLVMGNYGGTAYGAGPIVHFASPELQERILPDILTGKKRICLAITEPNAGSDVANVSTTAKLSADGKYYVVNGLKKWIT